MLSQIIDRIDDFCRPLIRHASEVTGIHPLILTVAPFVCGVCYWVLLIRSWVRKRRAAKREP